MDRPWMSTDLGEALIRNDDLITKVPSIVADLQSRSIDISKLVEHMASVLTHKEAACRERGVRFLSSILLQLPLDLLTSQQLKFISVFYADRLRDHHSVVPAVLEGFFALTRMPGLTGSCIANFLTVLFREVSCQAQLKTDRANAFRIILQFLHTYPEDARSMGDNLTCGVITAIEGERDPNNLLLTLKLAAELSRVCPPDPGSQLSEELLDVLSCYFPVDYTPPQSEVAPVTREEIAKALAVALTALPQFAEPCLLLLIEKLDSSLRLAKIDSLQLLERSFNTFPIDAYLPFLKSLWSSIQREISQKYDSELKAVAHSALRALVNKLSEKQETLESFLKPVLSGLQAALAGSNTVTSFTQVSEALLTCARATVASCKLTADFIIPHVVALHSLRQDGADLRVAALSLLGDLYVAAKDLDVKIEQAALIPQLCSDWTSLDIQHRLAALKVLAATAEALPSDQVPSLVNRLISESLHEEEEKLRSASIVCLRVLTSLHPESVPEEVFTEKLTIDNSKDDKLFKRSVLVWSNLSCVDSLTRLAMDRLMRLARGCELATVAGALVQCVSVESVCSDSKLEELNREYGLVDSILAWLCDETARQDTPAALAEGYSLIAITVRRLSSQDQLRLVDKHTDTLLKLCEKTSTYLLILEALYNSLRRDVVTEAFPRVAVMATQVALLSQHEPVRLRASVLLAHLINKPELEQMNGVYTACKQTLASINAINTEAELRQRELMLYAWIVKSLLLRNDERFKEWFLKIIESLGDEKVCNIAANSFDVLVSERAECLAVECHCRVSPLSAQRLLQTMLELAPRPASAQQHPALRSACLLSWVHVLSRTPHKVLKRHLDQLAPLLLDSLTLQDGVLLERALVAMRTAIEAKVFSLQTLLPRLINLISFQTNMKVRIRSLECLLYVAASYSTVQLLPYRDDILTQLSAALDDAKRLVRSSAVQTCSRWVLVGAPGEPAGTA